MLKLFRRQKFFFFLNSVVNLNKQLTTMFKTKRKKYNKNIIIKVRIDEITTKLQQIYNDKILIKFNNIKKQSLDIIVKNYNNFDDINNIAR